MKSWMTRLVRICSLSFLPLFFFAPRAWSQESLQLPAGQAGRVYHIDLATSGGRAPLTWQVTSGALPPGISISASGTIEGTPTEARKDPYSFLLRVSDSSQPAMVVIEQVSLPIEPSPPVTAAMAEKQSPFKIVAPATSELVSGEAAPATLTAGADPNSSVGPTPSKPVPSAQDTPANKQNAAGGTAPSTDGGGNAQKTPTPTGFKGGPLLRTIVGFEQAGVSAAQSQQDFFFDMLYDRPIGFQNDGDLGPALRSFGNLRISSVPQQISTDVATFVTGFATQVGQLKVNEVAQSFEFLGGIDYRLLASKANYVSTDPVNDGSVHTRMSLSFILAGGVVTPLSPKESVQIFAAPTNQPDFFTQFPQAIGKQFVVFTLPDRNRFFRQAYGGFRIKTNFLGDEKRTRYPETFDLTYGFNESVTGGRIRGGVLRLEAFVPIPISELSWIYFFGTGLFKPGARSTIKEPFLLAQAPTGTLPTDPNAVIISTPQGDRDYYRVGIGIDLITLVKSGFGKNNTGGGASSKAVGQNQSQN